MLSSRKSWIKSIALFIVILMPLALGTVAFAYWLGNADAATNWQKVYNNSDANNVYALTEYNGQLYEALGFGSETKAMVKRYNGGTTWSQVNSNGFGDPNNYMAVSMKTFNNCLYVGTSNPSTGAEVWAYNEITSTWSQVNQDGFGYDFTLYECKALEVYNNELYAIVSSNGEKFRVYKYSGFGTLWTQVDTGAWDANNYVGLCAKSFGDSLWIGTENTNTGTEIWRYNGATWTQANTNGFSFSHNNYTYSFGVDNNQLYCGTGYMARVFRYNSGTSWSQIGATGLTNPSDGNYASTLISYGGKLYAGTMNNSSGCEICSWNGSSWTQEAIPGFGNNHSLQAGSMAISGSKLYVGTDNANTGAEVWRTTPPPTPYTIYLAEGSTAWGFDCYISIENPQTFPVTVALTYQTNTGPVAGPQFVMAAKSQATINPRDTLGNQDFSTKIKCLDGKLIAADRTMIWNRCGEEGHNSIGVTAPAKTWYLAEGSSEWGFECWLLIQNPNASEASCNVTYMIEGRGPVTVNKKVPANSRKTFFMADDIGSADASIKVVSNLPVIPERAMYRNNRREGHDSIGTTTPAQDYYLAEGTSAWGFTTYVLVQNPNNSVTSVTVTYMTKDGPVGQAPFNMPPNSRKTIRVNDVLPNVDFSTKVHGNQPIIAERAMYWNNGTGEACHDSIGMDQPHMSFYLPDGQTSNGRETWTLVQNPNNQAVTVEISYLTPNGAGNVVFTDTIPANSRRTYNMVDKGVGDRAAVTVRSLTSGKKIMVERAMYWNARGAGTDTIGGFSD